MYFIVLSIPLLYLTCWFSRSLPVEEKRLSAVVMDRSIVSQSPTDRKLIFFRKSRALNMVLYWMNLWRLTWQTSVLAARPPTETRLQSRHVLSRLLWQNWIVKADKWEMGRKKIKHTVSQKDFITCPDSRVLVKLGKSSSYIKYLLFCFPSDYHVILPYIWRTDGF